MRTRANGHAWVIAAAAGILAFCGAAAQVQAQTQLNPVYVDDSPVASETFSRVKDHLAAGNTDEAVRVLQILLDEQGERVISLPGDPDLFISVREAVHRLALGDARLLDRYRQNVGPRAAAMLEQGDAVNVERQYLMTAAGLEAALRVAQRQLEAAQFEAALRTLAQLEDHPDRRAQAAKDAAALLAAITRYVHRDEVKLWAERWANQAGVPAGGPAQVRWPAAALVRGQSPLDEAKPIQTKGLVSKPLWSAEFAPASAIEENLKEPLGDPGLPRGAESLLVMPSVSRELVFVNDSTTISAWDQFTLAERWRVNPAAAGGDARIEPRRSGLMPSYRGWTMNPPDVATVAIKGRTVVAATGRNQPNAREGDTRISAIDAQTGRIKWSVELGELDPSLVDAGVRGPLVIDEGVVVVGARKAIAERRLLSLVLLGLDLETGAALWVRPLGSSGMLPYMSQPGGAEASLIVEGVVYRGDRLGAIGAFEVATGRPVWVRRAPVDAMGVRDTSLPWRIGGAIADGPWLYALSPDQQSILRLDRQSGRIVAQRATDRFGIIPPDYIVNVGRFIAGIGTDQIGFLPLDDFENSAVRLTARLPAPGIHGRVVVAGERLIVPVPTGLAIIDPASPDVEPLRIDLDLPGAIVPVESQLVIADDSRLHSYLLWDVAEAMLTSRMQASPEDPSPAVTFAELAYRADRPERILDAVDAALRAIDASPGLESSASAARRLFDALREMTTNSLEVRDPRAEAAGIIRGGPPLKDETLIAVLVDRMGRCATSPDDRVTHLMALGRVEERAARPISAVAAYQRVLDEPILGGATWRGVQLAVGADIEAVRRIEGLVESSGPAVYAQQEATAVAALAALPANANPAQLASLAAQYPLSTIVPAAYLRMAASHTASGQEQARISALDSGLRASVRVPGADPDSVGRLAGELIDTLSSHGQVASAASALRIVREFFPAATLRAGERTLDAVQLAAQLDERIAQTVRWPRIGATTDKAVQLVGRVNLLEPILQSDRPSAPACFVTAREEEVTVWSAAAAKPGELVGKAWQNQFGSMQPTLLRTDADGAFILFNSGNVGQIVRVPAAPGGKTWTTEKLQPLFDIKDPRGIRKLPDPAGPTMFFSTPRDEILSTADMTVAMDDRTIALVQRGGKAAAFDADTGQTLWSGITPVSRVYDTDLAGGVLVIAGDMEIPAAGGGVAHLQPIVQTIDARTGKPLQRLSDVGGRTHWVRTSIDGASLILGLDRAVVCLDLASGRANWVLTQPEIVPVSQAFVAGDRVVMVSPDRQLWQASISTGRLRPQPLDAPRTHMEGDRPLEAFATRASEAADLVISSGQGLVILGPEGELRGVDALGGFESLLPPRPADGRAVTIETIADSRTAQGLFIFQIHQLDTQTAMLVDSKPIELGAHPMSMTVLDGLIVLSGGGMTLVITAPAE